MNDASVKINPTIKEGFNPRWSWVLLAYVLIYATAWILLPLLINKKPPGDNFEQLRWAADLAWGYDKHPPFPTLVLWVFELFFPPSVPLTYVLGALDVLAMLICAWLVMRIIADKQLAFVAVLFISCLTYYTNRLHFYNHNTALLMAYAMSVYFSLRAAQTLKAVWFVLLGLAWGIGLLSKYQMVVGIACNLIFFLAVSKQRVAPLFKGVCIAGVITALVISPHVVWLVANNFPSFNYAAKFVAAHLPLLERPDDIIRFLADQLKRVAPLGVLLIIFRQLPAVRAALAYDSRDSDEIINSDSLRTQESSTFVRRFLGIHAWAPLALMVALSLFFGTNLQMHWGTAFIWMLPLWYLHTQQGQAIARLPPPTLLGGIVLLQLVMLLTYR